MNREVKKGSSSGLLAGGQQTEEEGEGETGVVDRKADVSFDKQLLQQQNAVLDLI